MLLHGALVTVPDAHESLLRLGGPPHAVGGEAHHALVLHYPLCSGYYLQISIYIHILCNVAFYLFYVSAPMLAWVRRIRILVEEISFSNSSTYKMEVFGVSQ